MISFRFYSIKKLVCLLSAVMCLSALQAQKTILADTLLRHASLYEGKIVNTEGKIVHVCPIGGIKMKLYTDGKQIIKVNAGAFGPLPKTYNGQTLQIVGTLSIEHLSSADLARNEKAGLSLCHIDETPCLDKKLQDRLLTEGRSEKVAKRDADRVRKEMTDHGQNDYPTVVITLIQKPIVLGSVAP